MLGISCVAEQIPPSQEELNFMELVIQGYTSSEDVRGI
jgi:hypothetical protein